MIETLLGGLTGGLFRLAPEVLKFFDAKNERAHELAMQDKAIEFEKLRGDQKMDELHAQGQLALDAGGVQALVESIKGQAAKTGIAWVDAMSSSVRPILTYWFMALYCGAKVSTIVAASQSGLPWVDVLRQAWTEADQALWAGVLNFWFVGRVFERMGAGK